MLRPHARYNNSIGAHAPCLALVLFHVQHIQIVTLMHAHPQRTVRLACACLLLTGLLDA